ncbi:uncharacterized protein LOC127712686 [Mytilus californianus]|uniref:uncharacterized protein LOC127712686 n=1 Tax=Mytilus californianus TaxID=6549 RepID=UPI0022452F6D|nr:uncharacterized protein LOC127712686 [Mytilus californianus]
MKCPSSILERYSIQISERMEPFSSVNTVYNRLFAINSSEISIRISLYFERRLLDYLPVINTSSSVLENTLTSLELNEQLTAVLAKGPLNGNTCLDVLRRNALDFQLDSDRTHRLPWKIQMIRCQVKTYLLECLSQDISTTLIKYLNDQMIIKRKAVADELDKMMDISMCWIDQLTFDILGIISIRSVPILGFASTPFSIASNLLFSVDVQDVSFRHQIADYLHEHIMAWRTEVIRDVHHRFKDFFWKKFIKLWQILNVFGKRNRASISFHEYKTITERNLQIEAYGLFGDIIKIYIHKKETNEESIREYLCKYCTDISPVKICEYKEMIVTKHCFKSGNRVMKVGNQNRYGTASFPLKDRENRYYCATCKHVTAITGDANIISNGGMALSTDSLTFNTELDFALLKLRNTNIVCNHGIRTEDNCFVSGEVLEIDMTPGKDDQFYKWGATTGLTKGNYIGIILIKTETTNYGIENFVIEGQFGQFSMPGDSGSLICISPDSIVYTSHMAACILVGECTPSNFDENFTPNRHMCYRVSLPLSEMKSSESYSTIIPCFSM